MLLVEWCPTCWSFRGGRAHTRDAGYSSSFFVGCFFWMACRAASGQQRALPRAGRQDRLTVENVVAPVLVFDSKGRMSTASARRFYRNGQQPKSRTFRGHQPISLVIAIQANSHVEQLLPHVQKIGNLITPLLIGDQGEAALIAYDARIRSSAGLHFRPRQNYAAGQEDLPWQHFQPVGRRRGGRHPHVDDAPQEPPAHPDSDRPKRATWAARARVARSLLGLQFANVLFYGVDMSRFMNVLTAPAAGRALGQLAAGHCIQCHRAFRPLPPPWRSCTARTAALPSSSP